MNSWRYIWTEKFKKKKGAEEEDVISDWHLAHMQYPVLLIPHPFRDKVRARITRFYGAYHACMPFYKDFYKCGYEVGKQVELEECAKEYKDMRECESSWKTKMRLMAINMKRHDDGLDFLERPPQYLFHRPFVTFRKETKI